jgi:exodeoxyribonuclease VII small subunit
MTEDKKPRVAGKAQRPRRDQDQALPFEKALERLQEIVEALESGEATLERSLALFEEGVALSRRCNQRLDEAERRLEILVKKSGGGDATEPFAEEEFFPAAGGEDEPR